MILVVDASVALKWFFRNREEETDCDEALRILDALSDGRVQLLQPPHFVAEMAAVLAREKPRLAGDDLTDLLDLETTIADHPDLNATAIQLSVRLRHHLFDTLYHAAALLTPGSKLITADETYYRKAESVGAIERLRDSQF